MFSACANANQLMGLRGDFLSFSVAGAAVAAFGVTGVGVETEGAAALTGSGLVSSSFGAAAAATIAGYAQPNEPGGRDIGCNGK